MKQYERFEMEEVKRLTNGQWATIFGALAPQLGPAMKAWGRHVPCPVHGGKDGFRLRKDSVEGHGLCATCTGGLRVDGFEVLMLVNGWSFPDAVKEVLSVVDPGRNRLRNYTPTTPVRAPAPATMVRDEEDVREDERKLAKLREVWSQSLSLQDAGSVIAHRYFESRGLKVPTGLQSILRFVPSLPYYVFNRDRDRMEHFGDFPALVAKVVDKDGHPVTLHRTYLALDGWGKAAVPENESAKKLMERTSTSNVMGCSIRLAPTSPVIAITEGIETALAVHEMTGFATWATVSSTFMEAFIPPQGVKAVWVWADKDVKGAGQSAAERLVGALRAHQLRVTSVVPPYDIPTGEKSIDWNDIYRQHGKSVIQMLQPFQTMARSIPTSATVTSIARARR